MLGILRLTRPGDLVFRSAFECETLTATITEEG
jgi:hypothetical protein